MDKFTNCRARYYDDQEGYCACRLFDGEEDETNCENCKLTKEQIDEELDKDLQRQAEEFKSMSGWCESEIQKIWGGK